MDSPQERARTLTEGKNRMNVFAEHQLNWGCTERGPDYSNKIDERMVAKGHTGCPCCRDIDDLRPAGNDEA